MKHTHNQMTMAGLALLCMAASGCIQENGYEGDVLRPENSIIAVIEELPEEHNCIDAETRVCIDWENTDPTGGSIYYYWTPEDEIGVFTDAGEKNIQYVNTNREEGIKSVTFIPTTEVEGKPTLAYFPYNANAGTDISAIKGLVPAEQTINEYQDNIPGIHRYGYYKSTTDGASSFGFKHVLSTIRWHLDVSGTELEGKKLHSIEIKVKRSTRNLDVCGDFTFNAETGAFKAGSSSNTHNVVTINFEGQPELEENKITFYSSLFPTIKKGDYLYFTINTVGSTATYKLKSAVTFKTNYVYTFSMPIDSYSSLNFYPNDIRDEEIPEEPETPAEPQPINGTFTCATYNVDGLPVIDLFGYGLNVGGPESDGTKEISAKIAGSNWDFVGFSEDFNYHSELTSSMSNYNFGEHRGTVGIAQISKKAETDGLGFAWKKDKINATKVDYVPFVEYYGGLLAGANDCITKGIRHYEVTVAEGVVIDVLITHMNTYSDDDAEYINAQHAQLKQIAQYINNITTQHKRPVILMGDTNCRYTRHDFQTYFWDVLNNNLLVSDPWVLSQWDGNYPTYPSNSLVVEDATGTSASDIICSSQAGEVVDKVIYINCENFDTIIAAYSYLRDTSYIGLADHCPVVVDFYYEKIN